MLDADEAAGLEHRMRFFREPDEVIRDERIVAISAQILQALVEAHRSEDGEAAPVSAGPSLEALAFTAAMMLEAIPGLAEEEEMREAASEFSSLLVQMIDRFRQHHAKEGSAALAMFGGSHGDPKVN